VGVRLIFGDFMRAPQPPRIDLADAGLKFTGVALATGSIAFATHMLSDPGHPPRITGVEHLAIYARPARHGPQQSGPPSAPNVDYTPVGSIRKKPAGALLAGYEILDATSEWALVRLPEGRILRVWRGGRIGGLGGVLDIQKISGRWALVTERGTIGAR
jgi:hypothetical protein